MDEYQTYILSKVPPGGIDEEKLREAGLRDIEQKLGPFSGCADPSYARGNFRQVLERLVETGYLLKEDATIKLSQVAQKALEQKRRATLENVERLLYDLYGKGHALGLVILQLALEKIDHAKLVKTLVTKGWSEKAIQLGLSDLAVRGLIRSPYQPEIVDDLRPKVQSWIAGRTKDIVRLSTSKVKESEVLYSQYPVKIGTGQKLEESKIRDLIIDVVSQSELRGMEILDIDTNGITLALDQTSYELQYVEKLSYLPISTDRAVWTCQEIEPSFYKDYCSDSKFEVRKRTAFFELVRGYRLSCMSDYFFNMVQEIIENKLYGTRFLCPFENIDEEFNTLVSQKNAALEQERARAREVSKTLEAERTLHKDEIKKMQAELTSQKDTVGALRQELESD